MMRRMMKQDQHCSVKTPPILKGNSGNKLLLQNTKGFAFPNPVNDERERVKRGGEA